MRVLMVTTEFPSAEHEGRGIFVARQAEALRRAGVEVDVLHFISRASLINHWRAWRRLRRMMASSPYDIVHAQFGHSALVARAQFAAPVVISFRGDDLQGVIGYDGSRGAKARLQVILSQLLALVAQGTIVVSERLGEILWRDNFHVIPSGLDLDRFRPLPRDEARRRLGWPPESRVVLFAAQDIRMKNKRYELARAAVERVSREVPAELYVASDIPPDRIYLHFNASDVLLLTSIQEGSPNVVKEALACNTPVVAVDVGDIRERLRGVQATEIAEATPEALGRALLPLLACPTRSNGRQAMEGLSEDALARRVIQVYEKAMGQ